MFAKAKRFDAKNEAKKAAELRSAEPEIPKTKPKTAPSALVVKPKPRPTPAPGCSKSNVDARSLCGSVRSAKSFVTPKPVKSASLTKCPSSLKKPLSSNKNSDFVASSEKKVSEDIIKSQEVEIRNKDHTIAEYLKQIEELKNDINNLQKKQNESSDCQKDYENLHKKISEIHIGEKSGNQHENEKVINDLRIVIASLEGQCNRLEHEISTKQVELSSLEEIICIRDSLCKDLQDKLTNVETTLDETKQRLEMVQGHHALALEANESIRREYKAELESIKLKLEEEKQAIITKCKQDQEAVKIKYQNQIESIENQLIKEKDDAIAELLQRMRTKDIEMKAKLEQIDEATSEKLKLCEIQFEERFRGIQEHWALQDERAAALEGEAGELRHALSRAEDAAAKLTRDMHDLRAANDDLTADKTSLIKQVDDLQDEAKKKFIDFDNQINKLTVEVDNAIKEKNKFEMSLTVTRDIVSVLTMRLRESDSDVEHLEEQVQRLTDENERLLQQVESGRSALGSSAAECAQYKAALAGLLRSKAALAAQHERIMEHNASLAESLQHVELEAARELGEIQSELIEDVELLKKESNTQIQSLREEVEKKRAQVSMATEAAGAAAAAAEQARALLGHAAAALERQEADNRRLTRQIQDQQSLVVELSLLRQENEELSMTVAKQSSLIDKLKKDAEHHIKPKSPSVMRKNHKIGKENAQIVISPLRERNLI